MRKVLLITAILLCFTASLWATNEKAQEHAAQQASEQVPYQSALRDRLSLPGERLLGDSIREGDPSYYVIGWAEPVGPGRQGNPERGAGRVTFRILVDGTEVRFNTSGCVEFVPSWGIDMVINDHWYEFPAFYFLPGEHMLTITNDVPKLGISDQWDIWFYVEAEEE